MPEVKRTITLELALEQKRLSDPQISPDGTRIAYVMAPSGKTDEHATSEIWVVDTDVEGEEATSMGRRFTAGAHADSAPRWSPDGQWLAFVSDREEAGKGQVYVMSTHGGEATRLTDLKGGVSQPSWSPNGSLLAFLAKDPETEDEEKDTKERRDAVVVDENLKYHRLYVIDSAGGEPRQLSPSGAVNVWDYGWSSDGSRLVVATSATPKVADYREPNDLRTVDLEGGCRTLLTFDSGMSHPIWSPDGDSIAFLGREARVIAQDALWSVSAGGGEPYLLTSGYAGSIFTAEWSADGKEILFVALENLYGAINSLNPSSDRIRSLLPAAERGHGYFGADLSLDRARKRFATVRSDALHPMEVWTGTLGKSLRPVTNANRELAELRLARTEAVEWQSTDGLRICGLLVYPLDYEAGKRYPLILEVHGGPAGYWADRFYGHWHDWAQLLAAVGYAVLMPNPRGSLGRGAEFTNGNFRDLGGMELQDNLAGVEAMVERGIADPDRLGVGGWSHGGYMTAWTVTQDPDGDAPRFKGAVMGAGVSNMVSDQGQSDIPGFNLDYFYDDMASLYGDVSLLWDRSPMKYITRVKTPTLVLHGEKDERVTMPQGQEFYRGLKALGVPTQMVVYPREPHSIGEREHQLDLMRRVLEWFGTYVKNGR